MQATQVNQLLEQFGDHFRDLPLHLQALDDEQLLIVLKAQPRAKLCLSPESEYTRQLDRMGISDECKTGDAKFDAAYVVHSDEPQAAATLIDDRFKARLHELGNFTEFELTSREYRLLVPNPKDVGKILDVLADLVELTRS